PENEKKKADVFLKLQTVSDFRAAAGTRDSLLRLPGHPLSLPQYRSLGDSGQGGQQRLGNRPAPAARPPSWHLTPHRLGSPRWQRIDNASARPQRLLWASTGTKDPKASDVFYIKALAAPFTVNTMPEGTLNALADHGDLSQIMSADGGDCEKLMDQFASAGIDVYELAATLQDEGAKSFVNSWNELMGVIDSKSATLAKAS